MGKLKRRFLFGDLYNIQAYEEYFAEMSREGLHLEKLGFIFAYFKEGDPEDLNYRIDMFKKGEKEIKIRKHEGNAWKFVGEKEPFLVFSSKENSGLEELYQTPEAQRLALKDANQKSLASNLAGVLISIIAILVLVAGIYMQVEVYKGFFLLLVEGSLLKGIILPILISVFRLMRQRWHLNRVMKTLKSGEFLSHYGNHLLGKVVFLLRNIGFGLFVGLILYQIFISGASYEIDDEAIKDLPILRVVDIETKDYTYPSDLYNSLSKSWSFFAPKRYELWESVEIVEDNNLKDLSLYVDYYLGRFDIIAKGLEEEIFHREEKYNFKFNKLLEKDGAICYGGEDENRSVLLCRKDLEVVLVRYYNGTSTLDDIMNAIIKKLGKTYKN